MGGSLKDVLEDVLAPGLRVFVPGSSGEPAGVVAALYDRPELTRGLRLTTTFVPGLNRLDLDQLDPSCVVEGLFPLDRGHAAEVEGRFRRLVLTYADFQQACETTAPFDVAIVQVGLPDADGRYPLGAAAEFTPTVTRRARALVGIVNPAVPAPIGGPTIEGERFDRLIEVEGDLAIYDPGQPDPAASRIAASVAELVEDGAILQIGLGKVPAALCQALTDRRGLRLHSGLLSDGAFDLADHGALAADWSHTTCVVAGSRSVYGRLARSRLIRVAGCEITHSSKRLVDLDRLVAVNSALEVDLLGQANLESANGRIISAPGGAPDFARAARQSPGGISVVALPAGDAVLSRIVPRFTGAAVSLPRSAVDVVVTEHGVADLRGRSVVERAEALINIAHPDARSLLADAWRDLCPTV